MIRKQSPMPPLWVLRCFAVFAGLFMLGVVAILFDQASQTHPGDSITLVALQMMLFGITVAMAFCALALIWAGIKRMP